MVVLLCFFLASRLTIVSLDIQYNMLKIMIMFLGAAKVFGSVMTAGAKEILLEIKEVGPLDQTDYCYERSEYTFFKADKTVLDKGK